jgi:hypothetical protein
MSDMAEFVGGGRAWWFPLGAEDQVRVTEEVMSYEIDGELRLAESFVFSEIQFGIDAQDAEPDV